MNENLTDDSHAATPRSFTEAIAVCFSKYATFKGRASRSEFWWFILLYFVSTHGLGVLTELLVYYGLVIPAFYGLIGLVLLIPLLAVSARRLHDIGRSGWWWFLLYTVIGIPLLIYWWTQKGEPEQNQYQQA